MTREEVANILMTVQAAYPSFNPPNKNVTVNTWFAMLQEYDYRTAMAGLKAYIASDTKGFPPAIGQIIGKMHDIREVQGLNELEAWAMVSKAIRNGAYNSVVEFEKLPPEAQRAIGSASQIRTWAIDENYNEQVVSSNFMRTYRQVVAQAKEFNRLPSDVRSMISQTANSLIPEKAEQ